jgi:hypothetical protein
VATFTVGVFPTLTVGVFWTVTGCGAGGVGAARATTGRHSTNTIAFKILRIAVSFAD